MSSVSQCLHVLKSTGLPILEMVLPEREYNKLQMEILRSQMVFDNSGISSEGSDITFLGIKIKKANYTITLKEHTNATEDKTKGCTIKE